MILKKIALVALSNPINNMENVSKLLNLLDSLNIIVIKSNYLIHNNDILNRDNQKMAEELIHFLNDTSIDGVFDISGGDLSNSLLPFIDFSLITNFSANFFGYSDLTVILNAFIKHTNINIFNYQILNIVKTPIALTLFKDTFLDNGTSLFNLNCTSLRNDSLSPITGIAIGGNIRCFLKLAGTPHMPDLKNKILLLESYSGNQYKMLTFINQLLLLKDFSKIKAIVLGNFTEMDNENLFPSIEEIFLKLTDKPLFRTVNLGHNADSHCIKLSEYLDL